MERRPARASQDGAPSEAIFPRGGVVFAVDFAFGKAKPRYGVFELFRLSPLLVGWAAILFERNSED